MELYITREEWNRKAEQLIIDMSTSHIENDEKGIPNAKYIITDCKRIQINGINIQTSNFSVGSNYMDFGDLVTHNVIDGETDKKIGEYQQIDEPIAKMQYGTIKTLFFEQEIGTSKRNQKVSIYIKDSYSTLKNNLVELS